MALDFVDADRGFNFAVACKQLAHRWPRASHPRPSPSGGHDGMATLARMTTLCVAI